LNSNDIESITAKQEAIKELSSISDWRQHYQVTASLIQDEVETDRVVKWLSSYQSVIPKVFKFLPLIFSLISLAVIVVYGIGMVHGAAVFAVYIVGINITGIYLKKINKLYNDAGKMRETFAQYAKLIKAIEDHKFSSSSLVENKRKLETQGVLASDVLKQLSTEINNLDQRNNLLFGFLANGFLLWDLKYSWRIEKWMKEFDTAIHDWFDVVATFDALNSYGNFAFTHPEYLYPFVSQNPETLLKVKGLGHPLLDETKRVDNDIALGTSNFFIITGANMAGKSTFLRTVALNIVMANNGLPVCANTFEYKPIKLISSMRTTDSLQNDESYFFSELKRLKFIVDEIQQDTYFIILDEILKGTNSKDKAEGSWKFVERLVASKSAGLIATHDLSLCTLGDKFDQVENHYFDAEIINDELFFDYKFKEGICKNMNASFLLKKMEIV
jgi:hypothetical protein